MAKGQVKVVAEKAKKNKTPAQVAKAAANVAAYNRRCAVLAAKREFAAYCRENLKGYVGPDAVVLAKGERFARNCRSLYGYTGSDLEVVAQYVAAVKVAQRPRFAEAA